MRQRTLQGERTELLQQTTGRPFVPPLDWASPLWLFRLPQHWQARA